MNRLNFRREKGNGQSAEAEVMRPRPLTNPFAGWCNWRARRRGERHERRQQRRRKRTEKKQQRRRRAQRLQPKLTRSYLWVTVLAVLAIELCIGLLAARLAFRPALSPAQTATEARRLAARLAPVANLLQPKNAVPIAKALQQRPRQRMTVVVTDAKSRVLAAVPDGAVRIGIALPTQTLPAGFFQSDIAALSKVATALSLTTNATARKTLMERRARDGGSLAVAPIRRAVRVQGLVWVHSAAPVDAGKFFQTMLGTIIICTIVVGVFASVVGAGFGWFTARRLTRRLEAIEAASAAWGQGEFGVLAVDEADDEIGQLARRLNAMAQELQELVALRQNLATAEERNHLARELHDTVKQQVFATVMQIAAAKSLLDRNPDGHDADGHDAARARLETAEELARGAQSELTSILEQLRPGSYLNAGQSTLAATHEAQTESRDWLLSIDRLTSEWSRQSGIALTFEREVEAPPLPHAAAQSLQRLVQEALSNIARHSAAAQTSVRFSVQPPVIASTMNPATNLHQSTLMLEIVDNGCGFEPDNAPRGLGLQSMRERAESLVDGRFEILSRPGQGTQLRVFWRCDAAI